MFYWLACVCIDHALGSALSARAYRRSGREDAAWEARIHAGINARWTVGINVGHAETAAGAVDHVLSGGSSAEAVHWQLLCHTGVSHLCIDAAQPRSRCGIHASAWPASGLRSGRARVIYSAGRSQRGRVRPRYCLVITLDRKGRRRRGGAARRTVLYSHWGLGRLLHVHTRLLPVRSKTPAVHTVSMVRWICRFAFHAPEAGRYDVALRGDICRIKRKEVASQPDPFAIMGFNFGRQAQVRTMAPHIRYASRDLLKFHSAPPSLYF